jgi:hypothetical protein
MNASQQQRTWDAIAIHPDDSVAIAMRGLEPGQISVRVGQAVRPLTLLEAVGIGHKISLQAIAEGAEVRKYGEVIGVASRQIAPGAHVHIHNLRSRRAQANA